MAVQNATKLQGKRVLVTGGTGFIGSHLCLRLRELGAEVVAVSRSPQSHAEGMRVAALDLTDRTATGALVKALKPEVVFHLASHVEGTRSIEAVLPTFDSNLVSTVNLLMAARENDCQRVVLTGSLEEPEPSEAWPVPSSPYAAAKAAASSYGRMFHALFDLPVVILRLFMVYGPGQADRRKLIPYVISCLLKGQHPKLSSGTREVDWIFVDDVVEAYIAAASAPKVGGETVDVGSGVLTSVASIVEHLYEIVDRADAPDFGDLPDRPLEQIRRADVTRTRELLSWSTNVALLQGLKRTVAWYADADRLEARPVD